MLISALEKSNVTYIAAGMNTAPCTLSISTYNWPAALAHCLDSVLRQTAMPAQVVIGDDGSGPETRQLVQDYQKKFPVPLVHVWQPDEGFKLAQIRNKSFAAASKPYIIQIDGDLVLDKHFVADHCRFARKNTFVCGTRAMMPAGLSDKVHRNLVDPNQQGWRTAGLEKKYNAWRNRLLSEAIYSLQRGSQQYKYVIGANMAFWKNDLVKVNGYNEAFTGWGKEDNELALRLCNAGVGLRFIKFAAVAYHLYHKGAQDSRFGENERLLEQTLVNKIAFAPKGLNAYL